LHDKVFMKKKYYLPYGKTSLEIHLDEQFSQDLYLPISISAECEESEIILSAIRNPLNSCHFPKNFSSETKVAITINDKTRPVPNDKLFPPLLAALENSGLQKENVTILIATGTHIPMKQEEIKIIINPEIVEGCHIVSHDCDKEDNLVFKGTTSFGTPVFVNCLFDHADIKIVVGDIEPHHFAGFSGGAKSASIGVCGRQTITHNHTLLQNPKSVVGRYEDNPLRQDIEEIGDLIGIDFALNAILNEKKEIIHVFFGKPRDVMLAGIKIIRENELTPISEPYDLVIASAGGYPKDINLYQAQKALTHASLFCKDGGTVLLAVACEEGVGSQAYLDFMQGITSHTEAKKVFLDKGFTVGPHKAFQFAMLAERIHFKILTEIDDQLMDRLLIEKIKDMDKGISEEIKNLSCPPRIAIVPYATATIPQITGDIHAG
jgi:lactate racemase